MRIKHIVIIYGLLVAATLSSCSQGNSELNGLASPAEVSTASAQTADLTEAAESGAAIAQNVSFSAGENQAPEGYLINMERSSDR